MPAFQQLVEQVSSQYVYEFGKHKFDRISRRIANSRQVSKFIERARNNDNVPIRYVLPMLMQIPTFTFARSETLVLAVTLTMDLWNERCNANRELVGDDALILMVQDVFHQIGRMARGY